MSIITLFSTLFTTNYKPVISCYVDGLASFLLNRYLYDEPDYSSSSNSSDERNKFDYHKLINNIETDDESSSYSESAAGM